MEELHSAMKGGAQTLEVRAAERRNSAASPKDVGHFSCLIAFKDPS